MNAKSLLLLAGLLLSGGELFAENYAQQVETARVARLDQLTQPDGWLALIGQPSLRLGVNTLGRAADNRIVLPAGPAHFGAVTVEENGRVTFLPSAGSGVRVDGAVAALGVELRAGSPARHATLVTAGTVGFYLVESEGKRTLHVRDVAAPQLVDFSGLDYFPIDPAWRIEAEWISLPVRRTGKAVFQHAGKTFELRPLENLDGNFLFVFSDTTSGAETYTMRFLAAGQPHDGKVVLDFNLATNPPCAFSPLAVCPLPPPENQFPFAVTAGEKVVLKLPSK